MDTTEAEVRNIPLCDMCKDLPAVYDGMTLYGPWAYMCQSCWELHGIGVLGLGKGQKLVLMETTKE